MGASTRIGIGYDSHRFAPGGPLILGGVSIQADVSLIGHSDADAISHAVTDAVLGAAAAGDIGSLFPDNDDANRGRDSIEMLRLLLESEGAIVHEALSADAALALADSAELDVIISDISMPQMDGYELMRRLRSRPRRIASSRRRPARRPRAASCTCTRSASRVPPWPGPSD